MIKLPQAVLVGENLEYKASRAEIIAIIIDNGKLVFDGTPGEMQRLSKRHNAISLKVRAGTVDDIEALRSLGDVREVEECEAEEGFESFLIYPDEGASILGSLSRVAHEKSWEVDHLTVEDGRLDEVFRTITGSRT